MLRKSIVVLATSIALSSGFAADAFARGGGIGGFSGGGMGHSTIGMSDPVGGLSGGMGQIGGGLGHIGGVSSGLSTGSLGAIGTGAVGGTSALGGVASRAPTTAGLGSGSVGGEYQFRALSNCAYTSNYAKTNTPACEE
jgi:hypothetical protein